MTLPECHKLRYRPWLIGPVQNNYKTGLIDIFRDLSSYNAQNHPYTTRDGHLLGAFVDLTIKSSQGVSGSIIALQNSWKLRNAIRKFHFERLAMFEKAGITDDELGKYGHEMRPYFDWNHAQLISGEDYWNTSEFYPMRVMKQITIIGDPNDKNGEMNIESMVGGDWTRSTVASNVPALDGDPAATDMWNLHIAGEHIGGSGKGVYDSVGMILAYNEDRMEVVTPDTEETVVGNNPLALLRSQSVSGGAAVDIAEEQELEDPPYDITDYGDSMHLSEIDFFKAIPYTAGDDNTAEITIRNLWLPAGYLGLSFEDFPATDDLQLIVDVKSVWECRDLA